MNDREKQLRDAKDVIADGIDHAIVVLRGSVEFRNAVEELLKGTPHEKPSEDAYDFEGLYGRLRNALKLAPATPLSQEREKKPCGLDHDGHAT